MPENLNSWLTAKQVAERLNVSRVRSHELISSGQLHTIKTPLGQLVDPASVEAYLAQRNAGGRRSWNSRWATQANAKE